MVGEFPMVMTMQQLGAYAQVGEDTIRAWMAREYDPLPHMRLSDSKFSPVRFRRDLFDEWQRRQMVSAAA